ncbi:unnamed protein product [Brassica rapa subsp. narinosa]|uniref:(rape) hypothetical protein n=1 Tax=Brassica napus TaxID=3708 RepID=A0A817ACH8_BRANA|nr:unnamed protein product [Brassica napus]
METEGCRSSLTTGSKSRRLQKLQRLIRDSDKEQPIRYQEGEVDREVEVFEDNRLGAEKSC